MVKSGSEVPVHRHRGSELPTRSVLGNEVPHIESSACLLPTNRLAFLPYSILTELLPADTRPAGEGTLFSSCNGLNRSNRQTIHRNRSAAVAGTPQA